MIKNIESYYDISFPIITSCEHGEVFMEETELHSLTISNGKIEKSSIQKKEGFSIRGIKSDRTVFLSEGNLSLDSLAHNIKDLKNKLTLFPSSFKSYQGFAEGNLYTPARDPSFDELYQLSINIYESLKDLPYVKNIIVNVRKKLTEVVIINHKGNCVLDKRHRYKIGVEITGDKNGRRETVFHSSGIQGNWDHFLQSDKLNQLVTDLKTSLENRFDSISIDGGAMPIILGAGNPAIFFHEAIGHGLEADSIYKGTSCFKGLLGQKVASDIVNLIDSGKMREEWASINFDDEGNEGNETVLIEDGILKSYICDEYYGKKINHPSTSNCRRDYYSSLPFPRMTNTFVKKGKNSFSELINGIERGIYIKHMSKGETDTVTGRFTFSGDDAFLVEKGKISAPIKNITLSGMGLDVLKNIVGIGNDFLMETTAMCGKEGQWVPVTCSQPSLLISSLIVGC